MFALQRQLPFLKRIAKFHFLLVVFFENTELKKLSEKELEVDDVDRYLCKNDRRKICSMIKKLIVKELAKYNIQSILSTPQNLTINTINSYLEMKARQKI